MLTAFLFAAAFALGCFLAISRHPIYGLLTYVGEFYLHPPSRWWGDLLPDLRWSLIAAAATVCGLAFRATRRQGVTATGKRFAIGLLAFVIWCVIQMSWALDREMHMTLITLSAKYLLVLYLVLACIDSAPHLRAFLWTHVLGCFYFGWLAYTEYNGGRFEGFGGPGLGEANAGAIQIVTGILVASSLFLASKTRERVALLIVIPIIIDGLVTTISRSGFLALVGGGVVFNHLAPRRRKLYVRGLSALAFVLLLILTGPTFWKRMNTIEYAGEQIQGVDTGGGRLEIIRAQFAMFVHHPAGCGHRCTVTLSPHYLDDKFLTGSGPTRGRASHNTFMTLLVEQGFPGALFYFAMVWWTVTIIRRLHKESQSGDGLLAQLVPGVGASLIAIMIGDMFVDYLKLEARIWFVGITIVLLRLIREERTHPISRSVLPHASPVPK